MPGTPILIALGVYAVVSMVTLGVFAIDKRLARMGARRISERTLHALALLGGWPGTFAAFVIVRHKNRMPAFVAITVAIALVHGAAWALLSKGALR